MEQILFINACVRKESRTKRLADHLLSRLNGSVEEVVLSLHSFPVADQRFLTQRDTLVNQGAFDAPCFALARQFAKADVVVVAAPYWDLSFPAVLKQYFEQINVAGITFTYSSMGVPVSLCRAGTLYYVTTAGGPILSDSYGFGYVKSLSENFYHIPDVHMIKAEGLDILGADVEIILRRVEEEIDQMLPDRLD